MEPPGTLFDFPERLRPAWRWLPYALLLAITFALYTATLFFDFVWDDFHYIVRNPRIQALDWAHWKAIWTGTWLGHYAPVHHSFFALLHALFGLNPWGYHLGNLLVHGACVALLYALLARLESRRVALLASLLFAVYPANVETVAWVSESKSTLAFLFFLLSFWFFIRMRQHQRWQDGVWAGAFLVLSVLAKINTVVAPLIFLLYDYQQGAGWKTLRWKSLAVFFLISAAFTGIHLSAFHGSGTQIESAYLGGPGTHLRNLPLLLSFYLKMVLWPHPLSAWQMFPSQESWNAAVAVGWAGLLAAALLLCRSSRPLQFWGLWFVVFLLPVLQIVPFNVWVADRYLYIPAIGGFVLLSRAFFAVRERLRALPGRGLEMAALLVLAAFGWQTVRHLPAWRDDLSLWSTTLPSCPTSAFCHLQLGMALLQRGEVEPGMRALIRAVELRPAPLYLKYLADAYVMNTGDYQQALIAYNMILEQTRGRTTAEFYAHLARLHLRAGNLEAASQAIAAGKKISADDPTVRLAEIVLHWKLGHLPAVRELLEAASRDPRLASTLATELRLFWGIPADVERLLNETRATPTE